jgi:hypothetical protein
MRTLTVLFDANCNLCRRIRNWLQAQTKYVDLDFVAAGSAEAVARYPLLAHAAALKERDSSLQLINLCRQNEIAFGQPVNLMRPDFDADFAPGQVNVRMMILRFGQFTDAPGEIERLTEIRKGVILFEMVFVNHSPAFKLCVQPGNLFALQRRHSATTRHAGFRSQF